MRAIPKPQIDVAQLVGECVSTIADAQRAFRLQKVAPMITTHSHEYERAAVAGRLSTLAPASLQPNSATRDDFEWLYASRFAGVKAVGRPRYDEIMLGAPHGVCPMCGVGLVRNLDHHLPISAYPMLAITPDNLVPLCVDCNFNKKAKTPTCEADRFFHPYFDAVPKGTWLCARVVGDEPLTLHFQAVPPQTWAADLAERVRHHFNMLGLGRLYASQSSTEIASMNAFVSGLRRSAGAEGVRKHYEERAQSASAVDPNSWRAAMYRALASPQQLLATVQAKS